MKMWDIEGLPFEELEVFVGMKTRISIEGIDENATPLITTGVLESITWAEMPVDQVFTVRFFFKGRGHDPLVLQLPEEGVTVKIGSTGLEPKLTAADL